MRECRGAGVPRVSDSGRPAPWAVSRFDVASGGRLWLDALPFDGAVDGGAADAEEFGDLGGAVLAAVHQGDEVSFLTAVELGLLATQPALGLGDLHALAGAEPDQVGLELGDHGKDIEQQSADRVGGVIDRPAQAQADLPGGELVGDRSGVGQGPGQAVSLVTTRVSPARQAASASVARDALGWCRSGRDRRRSGQPRRPGRAEHRVERSGLVDRWSIGRTRQAARSWRTSRAGPARTTGGGRLEHRVAPDSNSKTLPARGCKGAAGPQCDRLTARGVVERNMVVEHDSSRKPFNDIEMPSVG